MKALKFTDTTIVQQHPSLFQSMVSLTDHNLESILTTYESKKELGRTALLIFFNNTPKGIILHNPTEKVIDQAFADNTSGSLIATVERAELLSSQGLANNVFSVNTVIGAKPLVSEDTIKQYLNTLLSLTPDNIVIDLSHISTIDFPNIIMQLCNTIQKDYMGTFRELKIVYSSDTPKFVKGIKKSVPLLMHGKEVV